MATDRPAMQVELRPHGRRGVNLAARVGRLNAALISCDQLRGRGTFEIEGQTFELRTSGLTRGDFSLTRSGETVAGASRSDVRPNHYKIELAREDDEALVWSLRRKLFARTFELVCGDRPIGKVWRKVGRRGSLLLRVPEQTSLPNAIFVGFVASALYDRNKAFRLLFGSVLGEAASLQ